MANRRKTHGSDSDTDASYPSDQAEPPNANGGPAAAASDSPPPPLEISSEVLLAGRTEIRIRHRGEIYRLTLTRSGKLILHK
jgi:hemin uptake protein HemP